MKKQIIILSSVLYVINLIVGCLLQSVFYCCGVTLLFSIFSIWFFYSTSNNSELNDESKPIETEQPVEKIIEETEPTPEPIKEDKTKDDNEVVYHGVFITKKEFDNVKDNTDWYYNMNKELRYSIQDINTFFKRGLTDGKEKK